MKKLNNHLKEIRQIAHERSDFLFLFDFDGTLSPIVKIPSKAGLPKNIKNILKKLLLKKNVKIAIISGRELKDLKKRVALKNIIYAGDHGMTISYKNLMMLEKGKKYIRPIARLAYDLERDLKGIKNICVDLKKVSVAVHLRRVDRKLHSIVGKIVKKSSKEYLKKYPFQITKGKMVLEIRPKSLWNKGDASLWILERFARGYLPVYAGDDVTDEDAFDSIGVDGITVLIGKKRRTKAGYYCENVNDLFDVIPIIINK